MRSLSLLTISAQSNASAVSDLREWSEEQLIAAVKTVLANHTPS
jgi:hypothetical protein